MVIVAVIVALAEEKKQKKKASTRKSNSINWKSKERCHNTWQTICCLYEFVSNEHKNECCLCTFFLLSTHAHLNPLPLQTTNRDQWFRLPSFKDTTEERVWEDVAKTWAARLNIVYQKTASNLATEKPTLITGQTWRNASLSLKICKFPSSLTAWRELVEMWFTFFCIWRHIAENNRVQIKRRDSHQRDNRLKLKLHQQNSYSIIWAPSSSASFPFLFLQTKAGWQPQRLLYFLSPPPFYVCLHFLSHHNKNRHTRRHIYARGHH